uniref:Uncharacterized protein n=1 Tax=Leishmania guyanensis TaxID=5670 RepID=A0A1E1IZ34_LEIGU|nr:Hypothetical protein BN36_2640560 [Leishmania guyanensis]CCM16576.1 Hypothetical protein BN36_2640800 [Leishmania guyanensis]
MPAFTQLNTHTRPRGKHDRVYAVRDFGNALVGVRGWGGVRRGSIFLRDERMATRVYVSPATPTSHRMCPYLFPFPSFPDPFSAQ